MPMSLIALLGLAGSVAVSDARLLNNVSKSSKEYFATAPTPRTMRDVTAWVKAEKNVDIDLFDRLRITTPCIDELLTMEYGAIEHLKNCLASSQVRAMGAMPRPDAIYGFGSFVDKWADRLREIRWANHMNGQTGESHLSELPFESPRYADRLNTMIKHKYNNGPAYVDFVAFDNYRYKLMYILTGIHSTYHQTFAARVYQRQHDKWVPVSENVAMMCPLLEYDYPPSAWHPDYVDMVEFKRQFYMISKDHYLEPLKISRAFWRFSETAMTDLREFEANGGGLKN